MLKKLKVTASVLAVSAMFLMPTAHAEQAAVMPAQEDENCIKAVMEFLGIDTEESKFGLGGSLFRKNGFEVQDGRLYHYTDSQLDVYQSGFVQIEDGVYHVSEEGSAIDSYPTGFAVVDGVLCHVSVTGSFFDSYPAGFATIDTSGNAVLDGYVDQALAECTNSGMTKAQKLRAAYLYVRDHGAYLARPHQARGTTDWAEESALFMFEHKKGNCYCFAGQFLYMARRLGYDAYVVSGGVGRKDSDHAWVMIHENGTPYIYDVELEWGYRAGKYGHAEYNMYKMPLNKTVFSYQFP